MEILNYFKIPSKCLYTGKQPSIEDFSMMMKLDGNDKKIFKNSVSKIHLYAQLAQANSNLFEFVDDIYNYKCITIFAVVLKKDSHIKTINTLLQKSLQDPTIIIYQFKDKFCISTALKRINKNDNSRSVVDDSQIQISSFFSLDDKHKELLNKIDYSTNNLKTFYETIDCIVSSDYIIQTIGVVPEILDSKIRDKSLLIQKLLEKKSDLIKQEKEETSMQGKINCHMKIKEIESQLESIK